MKSLVEEYGVTIVYIVFASGIINGLMYIFNGILNLL